MPFIGNQPAKVPLTSADITDGIIVNADINANAAIASSKLSITSPLSITGNSTAGSEIRLPEDTDNGSNYVALKAADSITSNLTFTLPSADGSANQVLQTNGSGTLSFASVSSDYVLLATTDASNSASVSFDGYFSATYKNYKVIISNLLASTDGTTFRVRYRQSNSDKTDANYISSIDSSYTTSTTGATDYDRVWNATSARLNGSVLDNVDDLANLNGEFTIYNPLGTSYKKCFTFLGGNSNSGGNQVFTYNVYGVFTLNTSALSGITFLMDSGNITVGNFKLYGIK